MEQSHSLVDLLEPLELVQYIGAPPRPKRLPRKLKKERKKDLVLSLLKYGWSQKQLKEFHTFSKTVVPMFKPFNI